MNLQYANDRDKAYGVAGMVVTLTALDGEKYLSLLDLDAAGSHCLELDNRYGMRGNPRMSAKIVWEQTLEELRLFVSMAIGNIVCRRLLIDNRQPTTDELKALRSALEADAGEHLGLDADEADAMFDNCHRYAVSLFRHDGICRVTHSFAQTLTEKRKIQAIEAIEILASLGMK